MIPPIPEPQGTQARSSRHPKPKFAVMNVLCALAMILGTLIAAGIIQAFYAEGVNFATIAGLSALSSSPSFVIASLSALLGALGIVWRACSQ